MSERELYAEIVKSGRWLYDGSVPSEVWIVKQNFEYHYEEYYSAEPERLNQDGECFMVVFARNGTKIAISSEELTLPAAVAAAERAVPGLVWDDHLLQNLYGGRRHSRTPLLRSWRHSRRAVTLRTRNSSYQDVAVLVPSPYVFVTP